MKIPSFFTKSETGNKMHRLFCGGVWAVAFMLYGTIGMLTFTACSDDGDDNGSSGSDDGSYDSGVAGGQITTADGQTIWLTGIGSYLSFGYYDEGNLLSFTETDGIKAGFTVSYDPFEIAYYCYDEGGVLSDIEFNSKGYITSLYDSQCNGTATFSYNSAGHITKATLQATDWDCVFENDFTWEDDLLTRITFTLDATDEEESVEALFDYTTSYPNATYQWVPPLVYSCDWYDYELWESLFYLGYLGKGPAYHPTTRSVDYAYYEESGSYSTDYIYLLNDDGTVNGYKTASGTKYTYFSYDYYTSDESD